MAHIRAESMKLYAEDAANSETPWENWEYKTCGHDWAQFERHPMFGIHPSRKRNLGRNCMTYKLFIDDERDPISEGWIIARRSLEACISVALNGIPEEISFDHDLGQDDTSMVFLRWLEEYFFNNPSEKFKKSFKYSIHSQNPVGAKNIDVYMKNLIKIFGE